MLSRISLQLSRSGKKSVEVTFKVPHKLKIHVSEYGVRRIDSIGLCVVLDVESKKEEGEASVNRKFAFVVFL